MYNTAPMKRLPVVVFSLFAVITAAKAASPTEELQAEVAVLQKEVASLTSANTAQSASIAALQHQVNLIAINPALGLGPFVTVSFINGPNSHAPNIYFSGANIHIVSGSGSTNDNGNPLGLGNLIIG